MTAFTFIHHHLQGEKQSLYFLYLSKKHQSQLYFADIDEDLSPLAKY